MLKWIAIAAGALVLLLAAVLAALPWFLNTPAFQAYVSQTATHALGRPVKFTSLSIAPFPLPTVKLRGLEVADDPAFRTGSFLTMSEGRIGIRLKPLLSGRVELADLTLEEPTITLIEDQRGRWNWASLGASVPGPGGAPKSGSRAGGAAAGAVLLSRINIVDGRMQYEKLGVKASDLGLEKINLQVSQAGQGAAFLGHGDAVAQPGNVKLVIREASLTPSGARSLAEMALHATVEIETRDVAPLGGILITSPGVTGPMKGRLEVSGTPSRFAATGAMASDRVTLSDERPQCEPSRRQLPLNDLRIPVAYTGSRLESAPLQAKLANGSVALRLTITLGSAPVATLKDIKATGVELGPVLSGFLCQPYAVMGPMDLAGEASLRLGDPWRTARGSGRLKIGPGKVMGKDIVNLVNEVAALSDVASAVLSPERRGERAAPLDFTSITATYTITDGVVKTDDLLYEGPDLRAAAAGTFGLADGRVNMNVTLTQGRNEVKGLVSGTAGTLHVVPTGVRVPDTRGIKKFLDKLFR
jgi:AsmA protein